MRKLSQIILEQEKSKKQKEYEEFFKAKLAEYGAESPADLSTEEKKKFFNEIESEWDGEVSEGTIAIEEDPGADVKDKVKDGKDGGMGAGKEVKKEMGDGDATSDDIEEDGLKMGKPKTSGDGKDEVTDDQKITQAVKEALEDIIQIDEAGDTKLMKRKLDSLVGSALGKLIDELAKKGFSKEEIEKYMELVVSDRVDEAFALLAEEEEDMIPDSWKVNEFGPLAGSGNKDELEDVKRKAMKQSERNKTVYVVMDKRGRYKTSNYYEEDNTFAGYHNGIAIDIDESLNECKKYAKPPKKR